MTAGAVHVVGLAAFDFHLDGRVRDAEAMLDVVDDGDLDWFRWLVDHYLSR